MENLDYSIIIKEILYELLGENLSLEKIYKWYIMAKELFFLKKKKNKKKNIN